MIYHRIRTALRILGIIIGTAFLTALLFTYLTGFLYAIAQAKYALQVP